MRKYLFRKNLAIGAIILLMGVCAVPGIHGSQNVCRKTIIVDDEGDGDYTSIQEAINNINIGDTIEVYSGTYIENVVVDKMLYLVGIDSELGIGNDIGKPVVDGGGTGTVIKTTRDGVCITGFEICNSGNYQVGIYLASHYNSIQDNVITRNFYGMKLLPSTGNQIINNIISDNKGDGLWLSHSHENTIENNSITGNCNNGISINLSSLSNHIKHNYISENEENGINISETSFGSDFVGNEIAKNTRGITISGSSDRNTFYHNNFIENTMNAWDNSMNSWDNEYPLGGNYWDDYTGNDTNGDGIGDAPYYIPGGNNVDWYPLMESTCENHPPNKPTIVGPTYGKVSISYEYIFVATDPDGDKLFYYVEWGDGTAEDWFGPYDSGEEAIVSHTWVNQGSYTIRAKTKEIHGNESAWATLEITMPKYKAINTPFFRFLENHPYIFPLLRHLLRL